MNLIIHMNLVSEYQFNTEAVYRQSGFVLLYLTELNLGQMNYSQIVFLNCLMMLAVSVWSCSEWEVCSRGVCGFLWAVLILYMEALKNNILSRPFHNNIFLS